MYRLLVKPISNVLIDLDTKRENMQTKKIREQLFHLQDTKYRNFQSKLIPTVSTDAIIGIRTPALRRYAKLLAKSKNLQNFLEDLPHRYFEENQLHAFVISEIKNYGQCIEELNLFLPYVDNWATCDQMSPNVFKSNRKKLIDQIKFWILSERTYVVRFGIKMLMQHFLDENFNQTYLDMVAKVRSKEYYVKMMVAWYFATALAKHYNLAITYIKNKKLDVWTHNKAIQKSLESYRIAPEHKKYLKSLKIRKPVPDRHNVDTEM